MWRALFLVATVLLVTTTADVSKEKHDFKSDVSKMLDIIIHSLYTNRNIFLREVISNGSDVCDPPAPLLRSAVNVQQTTCMPYLKRLVRQYVKWCTHH